MVVAIGIGVGAGTLLLGVVAGMAKIATVYREEWREAVGVFAPPFERWTRYCLAFGVGWGVGNGAFPIADLWVAIGVGAFLATSAVVRLAFAIDKYVDRKAGRGKPH